MITDHHADSIFVEQEKWYFCENESANKAEINILSARDTTRPGPWARSSWVMMQWYIRESVARGVHLGLRTNRSPLADDKFSGLGGKSDEGRPSASNSTSLLRKTK